MSGTNALAYYFALSVKTTKKFCDLSSRFYYTVVREFNTFWTRQESQTVLYRSGVEAVAAQAAAVVGGFLVTLFLRRTQA
jgi:hypothetical protein